MPPVTSLYARYMEARQALRDHEHRCPACRPDTRCSDGGHLFAEFARLQDTYLTRQKKQR